MKGPTLTEIFENAPIGCLLLMGLGAVLVFVAAVVMFVITFIDLLGVLYGGS